MKLFQKSLKPLTSDQLRHVKNAIVLFNGEKSEKEIGDSKKYLKVFPQIAEGADELLQYINKYLLLQVEMERVRNSV